MPKKGNITGVARKVQEQILSGKLPNVARAMIEVGYSVNTANKQSKQVTSHPDYQKAQKTFLERLSTVQDISFEIIEKKKSKASFRDGVEALDKAKKLEFLITGEKPTEAIAVKWVE